MPLYCEHCSGKRQKMGAARVVAGRAPWKSATVLNRGATVSFRALLSRRAAVSVPRVIMVLALVAVGGCGAQVQTSSSQPGGGLFARVFGQIGDLYLEPVSTRKLALSGLARLSRYDRSFGVSDQLGGGTLTVTYDDRNI